MTTVREIEEAVTHLPRRQLDAFRAWFDKFDSDIWDKQFEQDARSGKLDSLAGQALKDLEERRCTDL